MRQFTARALPRGSGWELAREWTNRIRRAKPIAAAKHLYQGRAFYEARRLAELSGADFYVISAGLGVFPADKHIPTYSLTISKGSDDAIQRRCVEDNFSAASWWDALTRRYGIRNPLTELIAGSRGKLWLLALPSNYFELVASDLEQLSDTQLERVRIVGLRVERTAHRVLESCLLDIDNRLNGPDSPLPGTETDFAQRAARFFYDAVLKSNPTGDVLAHRRAVARKLADWRRPRRYKRQLMSDQAIMAQIRALWEDAEGRSSKMLRMLRDEEKIACEQSRFGKLFRQVQKGFLT